MTIIREYDIVALTENVTAQHKENKQTIILKRGQVGTVLMDFNQEAYLVDRGWAVIAGTSLVGRCTDDFADSNGNTYAMETISVAQLMVLIYEPSEVYA